MLLDWLKNLYTAIQTSVFYRWFIAFCDATTRLFSTSRIGGAIEAYGQEKNSDESGIERLFKILTKPLKRGSAFFHPIGEGLICSVVFQRYTFWAGQLGHFPLWWFGVLGSAIAVCGGLYHHQLDVIGFLCMGLLITSLYIIKEKKTFVVVFWESRLVSLLFSLWEQQIPCYSHEKTVTVTFKSAIYMGTLIGLSLFSAHSLTWLLWGVLLFTPLLCIYPIIGVMGVIFFAPFLPTMVLAGCLVFLLVIYMAKGLLFKVKPMPKDPVAFWVGLFCAVMLVHALFSYRMMSSVKIGLLVIAFVGIYFLLSKQLKTKNQLDWALTLFVNAGFLVSLYGIFQNFTGGAEATWQDTKMFQDIAGRVSSTFGNPNVLGEYLLLLIPISFGLMLTRKTALSRGYYAVVTLTSLLCMMYTYSRGCWLGLLLCAGLYLVMLDIRYLWIGLFAGVVGLFFLPDNVINRFTSIGDLSDSSSSYRLYIWWGTLHMLKDFWLSGIGQGIDAYNAVYSNYSFSGIVAPHAHSLYLVLLSEFGLTGLVAFFALMWANLQRVFVGFKKSIDASKYLFIAFFTGIIGFLFQGFTDYVWYNYRVVLIFWMVLGLSMAMRRLYDGERAV